MTTQQKWGARIAISVVGIVILLGINAWLYSVCSHTTEIDNSDGSIAYTITTNPDRLMLGLVTTAIIAVAMVSSMFYGLVREQEEKVVVRRTTSKRVDYDPRQESAHEPASSQTRWYEEPRGPFETPAAERTPRWRVEEKEETISSRPDSNTEE